MTTETFSDDELIYSVVKEKKEIWKRGMSSSVNGKHMNLSYELILANAMVLQSNSVIGAGLSLGDEVIIYKNRNSNELLEYINTTSGSDSKISPASLLGMFGLFLFLEILSVSLWYVTDVSRTFLLFLGIAAGGFSLLGLWAENESYVFRTKRFERFMHLKNDLTANT